MSDFIRIFVVGGVGALIGFVVVDQIVSWCVRLLQKQIEYDDTHADEWIDPKEWRG